MLDGIKVPNINVNSWKDIFKSLKELNRIIIVEDENINPKECEYAIGKVIKVKDSEVHLKVFDADGNWLDGYLVIPFRFISSVTFNSRYSVQWEKYFDLK